MPRTKSVKKAPKTANNSKLNAVSKELQNQKEYCLTQLKEDNKKALNLCRAFFDEEKILLPSKYINSTIREIVESEILLSTSTLSVTNSLISSSNLDLTSKSRKRNQKGRKRSVSVIADEGYLTADSVKSGGRKSRGKITMETRSRSLSRNNTKIMFKTPNDRIIPTYGVITPKCNPNTPQVLLRRPKVGEVALSMQGSPLYTASVVSDSMANINIPLFDGRMLTLQPRSGLRISQIPQFDTDTLHQLRMLRENLAKVCAASEQNKRIA